MQRSQTFSYYFCFFISGFPMGALGPSLPIFAESFSINIEVLGTVFSFFFIGYLLGSLLSGALIQRVAGHVLLVWGLFALTLVSLFGSWAVSLLSLFVVWGLLGTSVGILHAALNTLLIWVHKEKVAPYMNAAHFSFGLGALFIPLLLVQSVHFTGTINWVYWCSSIFSAVMMARLFSLQSPAMVQPLSPAPKNKRTTVGHPYVAYIVALLFLYVGAETSFAGWVSTYAVSKGIVDVINAAYLSSIFWAALTLGRLLWIPFSTYLAPVKVMVISILGCLFSLLALYFFGKTIIAFGVGIAMMGLSMSSIFPSSLSFLERRVHMTGYINSLCLAGGAIGGMFFPWLVGTFIS